MAIIIDGRNQPTSTPSLSSNYPVTNTVKNTDAAHFAHDVIDASLKAPVIVDFWAPWCEPCKTLGPLLERLVQQTNGAVHMVKVNVDQERQLAAQFRIQSVPTVYAFQEGRPVDGFSGVIPEHQIRQFISRLSNGNPTDAALEEAQGLLEAGDTGTALEIFQTIWKKDPTNITAAAGVVKTLVTQGSLGSAQHAFKQIPEDMHGHEALKTVRAYLDLMVESTDTAIKVAHAESSAAHNPDDLEARYVLAIAYTAANRHRDAANCLLDILRRDRHWEDGKARRQILKMFEAFGPTNPITIEARRQLSSLLFS